MKPSPVVVIRTLPETVHEDAGRALRLCATRRRPSRVGELIVIERGQGPRGVTPAWALEAIVEHRRAAHVTDDRWHLACVGSSPGRSAEPSLDRQLAAIGRNVDSIVAEGDQAIDVDTPWLRGRRGVEVRVDSRVAGRDLWWAGPLQQDRRFGLRGAVSAALSLVARPEEFEDGDPQTFGEAMRLFEATVAGRTFLLDASICRSVAGSIRPQVHNLLLAGRDPIALDAVAARVLGFDPERVAWLRSLAEDQRRDITPGGIALRGGAFESADAGAWNAHAGRSVPPIRRGESRRIVRLDPRRWVAAVNARRWEKLYARTPWGRLRDHARRAGRTTDEDRP